MVRVSATVFDVIALTWLAILPGVSGEGRRSSPDHSVVSSLRLSVYPTCEAATEDDHVFVGAGAPGCHARPIYCDDGVRSQLSVERVSRARGIRYLPHAGGEQIPGVGLEVGGPGENGDVWACLEDLIPVPATTPTTGLLARASDGSDTPCHPKF